MNTNIPISDDLLKEMDCSEKPGETLAKIRKSRGISQELVAEKLNLRVQMIQLLENDHYEAMPLPVFVRGYFRAYAGFLDITPDPFLHCYNTIYVKEIAKPEKKLWYAKHKINQGERFVRWLALGLSILVMTAVAFWWHNGKEARLHLTQSNASEHALSKLPDGPLSDVSKLDALFSLDTSSLQGPSNVG